MINLITYNASFQFYLIKLFQKKKLKINSASTCLHRLYNHCLHNVFPLFAFYDVYYFCPVVTFLSIYANLPHAQGILLHSIMLSLLLNLLHFEYSMNVRYNLQLSKKILITRLYNRTIYFSWL